MDLELLHLRRRHHAPLLFLMPPFSSRTAVCNEAHDKVTQHSCRNTMTQPTQTSIQLLFSSFRTSRDSLLRARPIDGHVSVFIGCTSQVCSVRRLRQGCLCRIPSDPPRADLKLAADRSLHSVGIRRPTEHLYLYVSALSKTPLHRSVQLLVFPRVRYSSCIRELAWPHSFVLASSVDCYQRNHSKYQKTTYQLLVVVSCLLYSLCAWHRGRSLLVRSASFKVHSCRVSHRQHMASVPVQHRRTSNKSRTVYPDEEHCQVKHQRCRCTHSYLGI